MVPPLPAYTGQSASPSPPYHSFGGHLSSQASTASTASVEEQGRARHRPRHAPVEWGSDLGDTPLVEDTVVVEMGTLPSAVHDTSQDLVMSDPEILGTPRTGRDEQEDRAGAGSAHVIVDEREEPAVVLPASAVNGPELTIVEGREEPAGVIPASAVVVPDPTNVREQNDQAVVVPRRAVVKGREEPAVFFSAPAVVVPEPMILEESAEPTVFVTPRPVVDGLAAVSARAVSEEREETVANAPEPAFVVPPPAILEEPVMVYKPAVEVEPTVESLPGEPTVKAERSVVPSSVDADELAVVEERAVLDKPAVVVPPPVDVPEAPDVVETSVAVGGPASMVSPPAVVSETPPAIKDCVARQERSTVVPQPMVISDAPTVEIRPVVEVLTFATSVSATDVEDEPDATSPRAVVAKSTVLESEPALDSEPATIAAPASVTAASGNAPTPELVPAFVAENRDALFPPAPRASASSSATVAQRPPANPPLIIMSSALHVLAGEVDRGEKPSNPIQSASRGPVAQAVERFERAAAADESLSADRHVNVSRNDGIVVAVRTMSNVTADATNKPVENTKESGQSGAHNHNAGALKKSGNPIDTERLGQHDKAQPSAAGLGTTFSQRDQSSPPILSSLPAIPLGAQGEHLSEVVELEYELDITEPTTQTEDQCFGDDEVVFESEVVFAAVGSTAPPKVFAHAPAGTSIPACPNYPFPASTPSSVSVSSPVAAATSGSSSRHPAYQPTTALRASVDPPESDGSDSSQPVFPPRSTSVTWAPSPMSDDGGGMTYRATHASSEDDADDDSKKHSNAAPNASDTEDDNDGDDGNDGEQCAPRRLDAIGVGADIFSTVVPEMADPDDFSASSSTSTFVTTGGRTGANSAGDNATSSQSGPSGDGAITAFCLDRTLNEISRTVPSSDYPGAVGIRASSTTIATGESASLAKQDSVIAPSAQTVSDSKYPGAEQDALPVAGSIDDATTLPSFTSALQDRGDGQDDHVAAKKPQCTTQDAMEDLEAHDAATLAQDVSMQWLYCAASPKIDVKKKPSSISPDSLTTPSPLDPHVHTVSRNTLPLPSASVPSCSFDESEALGRVEVQPVTVANYTAQHHLRANRKFAGNSLSSGTSVEAAACVTSETNEPSSLGVLPSQFSPLETIDTSNAPLDATVRVSRGVDPQRELGADSILLDDTADPDSTDCESQATENASEESSRNDMARSAVGPSARADVSPAMSDFEDAFKHPNIGNTTSARTGGLGIVDGAHQEGRAPVSDINSNSSLAGIASRRSRDAEVASLKRRLHQYADTLRKVCERANLQLRVAKKDRDKAVKAGTQLRAENVGLAKTSRLMRARMAAMESEMKAVASREKLSKKSTGDLAENFSNMRQDRDAARADVSAAREKAGAAKKETELLRKALDEAEARMQAVDGVVADLRDNLSSSQTGQAVTAAALANSQAAATSSKTERDALARSLAESDIRAGFADRELAELRREHKHCASIKIELDAYRVAANQAQVAVEEAKATTEVMREALRAADSRLQASVVEVAALRAIETERSAVADRDLLLSSVLQRTLSGTAQ
jgi:hypothetical protein